MPAIVSLEDLKAAQKEGLSIYAMLYVYPPKPWRRQALCAMRDVGLVRSNRMSFNWVDNSAIRIRQSAFGMLRNN